MKKFLLALILVLSLVLFANIKIGVVLPMTGGIAAFGEMSWQGIELAHEMYPEVLGEKIDLVLVDNRSEKTEAANAVSRVIDKEKVVAIIGEVASAHSLAGGAVAERKHIPMLTSSSTNPLVTNRKKYVSRVCFIDPYQGAAAAIFAFKNLNAKKAAVFIDVEQDYSVGLANFFKKKFQELGGNYFIEFFKTGDQEFSAQLTDAINKNPDVLYITGYYPEISLFARQARMLGFNGPILAGDGAEAPELIKIGGDAVEGLYYTTHFHPKGAATEMTKVFVEKFKEKYGEEPGAMHALGFDAYLVLRKAIEMAGKADPKAIAKAIREVKNFPGATGMITINKNGDAEKSVVIDMVKNGEFTYVTTINPANY